jgi:hypothetical protein
MCISFKCIILIFRILFFPKSEFYSMYKLTDEMGLHIE